MVSQYVQTSHSAPDEKKKKLCVIGAVEEGGGRLNQW